MDKVAWTRLQRRWRNKEVATLLQQINAGDPISIFNARKACYVRLERDSIIGKVILWLITLWLRRLYDRTKDTTEL